MAERGSEMNQAMSITMPLSEYENLKNTIVSNEKRVKELLEVIEVMQNRYNFLTTSALDAGFKPREDSIAYLKVEDGKMIQKRVNLTHGLDIDLSDLKYRNDDKFVNDTCIRTVPTPFEYSSYIVETELEYSFIKVELNEIKDRDKQVIMYVQDQQRNKEYAIIHQFHKGKWLKKVIEVAYD